MKLSYALSKWSLIAVILLLSSCQTPVQEEVKRGGDLHSKSLLNVNKYMQERNRELIMAFLERTGWEMQESATGLWYMILEEGIGDKAELDNMVVYAFETRLMSGELCYSANTIDPKKIVIGKGGVEAGIEEGLCLLGEGGKARLIVPTYLAHGNFGDRQEIPGGALLLVDLELVGIRK